ncbi:ATP-binding protein [Actinomadura sp. KC216]|uniref:ATP-binding protein n=1 Tax=Actinomadura sp. KC216 TaxID=2530370 RepID=UPI001404B333|nr:ATP-binding protein [Actinomadura sp. KC216]
MTTGAFAPGRSGLVLEPTDRAPAEARCYIAKRFRELGCDDDYVARIVVTELVTNAYKHVGFGQIVVRVFQDKRDDLVVIEVRDDGTGLPVVRDEDHDATCGRGLLLVVQLVHDWGVRQLDEEGKVVWARCGR